MSSAHASDVKGKVALITGTTTGLGKTMAEAFAAAGAHVVLTGRRDGLLKEVDTGIKNKGGSAAWIHCDVTKLADVKAAFDFAVKTFGGIDIVVSNAGAEGNFTPLLEKEMGDIQAVYDLNVMGTHHTLKAASDVMKKGGTFVFVSSVFSGTMIGPGGVPSLNDAFAPYIAAKSAVDALHMMSVPALTALKIRSYCIMPCQFKNTEASDRVWQAFGLDGPDGAVSALCNPVFKETAGEPKSIAEVVLAMADGSSKWPSGSRVVVDHDATFDSRVFATSVGNGAASESSALGWPIPEDLRKHMHDTRGNAYASKM